ncbi:MAG: hypothetical protein K0S41_2973 [Anaerocolumna sp.]|nr:hypothetical protein [Anaerocolumna sp.]
MFFPCLKNWRICKAMISLGLLLISLKLPSLVSLVFYISLANKEKNPLFPRDSFKYAILFGRKSVAIYDHTSCKLLLLRALFLQALHCREQQHIPNRCRISQQHYKSVNTNSNSTSRWHTIFQCI